MAVHGKSAELYFFVTRLSDYLNSIEMSVDVDTAETTTFGLGWKTHVAGTAGGTFSTTGFEDSNTVSYTLTPFLSLDTGVLTYCPAGGAVGGRARLALITATALTTSSPVGDVVAFGWDAISEAPITFGDVLHAYGTDTNTTTGNAKDELAATSTGWTAHLHCETVSAGSWVVTIQDSADGSSGWATIATFTALTGGNAERLRSASATTTVRRYIRYVATRTGGSASDTIKFFLAFARQNP